MKGSLTLLGTGGSMGIPVMGCDCSVCSSPNPYNQRTRPGALFQIENKRILVDTSQDIRGQFLREKVKGIDALVLTHQHHDHTAGVDDLRALFFHQKSAIPCYLTPATYDDLSIRYRYIFLPEGKSETILPRFDVRLLHNQRGEAEILGYPFRYFTFSHARMDVIGLRIGNIGFLSDIKDYPETIFEDLAGIDTLVVSALREEESPVHFNLEEALAFAKNIGPKEVWFTHIAHEMEHEQANESLPNHAHLAYDGLTLTFDF